MRILIDKAWYGLHKSKEFTVCYEYHKDETTFVVTPAELLKAYREGRLDDGEEVCQRLIKTGKYE